MWNLFELLCLQLGKPGVRPLKDTFEELCDDYVLIHKSVFRFWTYKKDTFLRNVNVTWEKRGNISLGGMLTTLRHLKQNSMFALAIRCI